MLAWQRIAMGFTTLGALTLGAAAHRRAPWILAPAGALFVVGASLWAYVRRRAARDSPPARAHEMAWLAVATIGVAVLAAVLAVGRPG